MTDSQYYIDLLTHMPVNKNKGTSAPHKAVLLLTIIDMIETGEITAPFIKITDTLKERFKCVWRVNVPEGSGYGPNLAYPFFHLSSSPFWELVKKDSHQCRQEYFSIKTLERDYSGAIIDVGLFRLLSDPQAREELRVILKSTYLSELSVKSKH